MAEIHVNVNGSLHKVDVEATTPLLWVLRDHLHLTGTKYGCGRGLCGSCTVHLNGSAIRSCSIPVAAVANQKIVTIERLSEHADHPVQKAWQEEDVPQCGYCQSGQVMSAVALLKDHPDPSDEKIDQTMSGNLCRCGTYTRIRKAIHRAAAV